MSLSNITQPNSVKVFTSAESVLGYSPAAPSDWSSIPSTFAEACDLLAASSGASGPVTSVGLSASPGSIFGVTGSPVTGAGTLALTLESQSAGKILAGPISGPDTVPSFRPIAVSDVPTLNQSTMGTAANITANTNSTLVTLPSLALGGSQVYGNISGSSGNITAAVNSTLTTLPSLTLPTSQLSGVIGVTHGGTGQSTASAGFNALSSCAAKGDIAIESAAGVVSALPIGSSGQVLTVASGLPSWQPPSSGTVTSVGLSAAPGSVFGISGSPVTTTGTIALSLNSQSGNLVLASPSGSSGVPSMRSLVNSDLPSSGISANTYYAPQVTFNAQGIATSAQEIVTSAGDLLTYSATSGFPVRFGVGSDANVLIANSANTNTGLSYMLVQAPLVNIGFSCSVNANALTITLTQADGVSSPVGSSFILFRSGTITSGQTHAFAIPSTTSITIPSGTTIGTTNSYAGYIYVYAIQGVSLSVNLAVSLSPFAQDAVVTTTAIAGGASATTIYSTSVINGELQYLGKILAPQATAGTWASAPTQVYTSIGPDYAAGQIVALRGDLLTVNSSSLPARLAIGTSNKFLLTANGLDPSWGTLSVGASLTGDGIGTPLALASSGVSAGAYGIVTVNAQGVVTSATGAVITGSVQTTNATATTIATLTTVNNSATMYRCIVTACQATSASNTASFTVDILLGNASGGVTSATTTVSKLPAGTVFSITNALSGTSLLLQVIGAAATTVNWSAWCEANRTLA